MSYATDFYYVGGDGDWNTTTNWKTGSCSGAATITLPTSTDNVYIGCNWGKSITLSNSASCKDLTIYQGCNLNLNNKSLIVSGNVTVNQATLTVGTGNLIVTTGSLTVNKGSGGTFSWTNGTVTVGGNFSDGGGGYGSITCGNGCFTFNGASFTNVNDMTIPYLKQSSSSFTKAGTGSLTISTFDMNCSSLPIGTINLPNKIGANNIITLSSAIGTNSQTKCINTAITNITYSTIGATGATFSGLPPGVTGNWSGNVVTISGTPSVAGSYAYTVTLTGGCPAVVTTTGMINVDQMPSIASNGSTQSVCGTGSLTLSGSNPTVGTGAWTVSGPSTSVTQFANPSLYSTSFTPDGGAGSYMVNWTISNGTCSSSAIATITVNAIPTPGSIDGSATKCSGDVSGILTLMGNSHPVSKWQSSSVVDFTSPIDIANTTATFTSGALSANTYYRAVISTGSCIAISAIATITIIPSVTIATNGSTQTICANVSATLSGNNPTVGTGAWTVSGQSSSLSQFANASLYNTTLTSDGGAGSYIVTWTISNAACSTSATATITVNAIPTAAGYVTGSNPICTGSNSGTLTLTGNSSNTIINWQSSTVSNFSSNVTNIGNTSSTYTSGALSATTYFRAVTSNGTCSVYSTEATIMVSPTIPSPAGSISGKIIQCTSVTDQEYSINDVNSASTYTWVVPSGWTITGGQGTTKMKVTTSPSTQTAFLSVTPSNSCGGSTPASLSVTVVSSPPAIPGTITGTGTVCHTVPNNIYSISPVANATSYIWTVPTGWSINLGAGTTSITATSGTSSTSGNITVSAANTCGISSQNNLAVSVKAGSIAPTSISGNSSVCKGNAITLTATNGTAYTGSAYQWGIGTIGSNVISGATSSSYTVTPSVANSTVTYWTRIMDASPCSDVPTEGVTKSVYVSSIPTFTVTATPNPALLNAPLSITGAPSGMAYVWSKNPTGFLNTFQNPTFTVTATSLSGIYTVTATDKYGCTATASTQNITVNSITEHTYVSGDITSSSSWTNPSTINFGDAAQTYIINCNCDLNKDWTVSGAGSKIIIESGSYFTIPSSKKLITTSPVVIDVKSTATLNIANEVIPNLGKLDTISSVINYCGSGNQTVQAAFYGNLTISNHSPNKVTLQPGYIGVYNVFTPDVTVPSTYITTGNTIVFNGRDQNIPVFPYNSLSTEFGGNKTLVGDIHIKNHFRVGAVTRFLSGTKSIYLDGTGELVSLAGTFNPGSGTVYYTNISNATVKSMNYFNLNTVNGPRILESDSIISVANVFTPGSSPFTVTGSTIEFNGSSAQTIPAISPSYYNLIIKTGTVSSPASSSVSGNVIVSGNLNMSIGILVTSSSTNTLTISNPAANAVSEGTSFAYVKGPLVRNLNAKTTATNDIYMFPVGDATYLPFSFTNYTTTANQTISLRAISGSCGGSGDNVGIKTSLSTTEYWSASSNSLTDDFKCRVSVSGPSLSVTSALGHYHPASAGASANGTYSLVSGTFSQSNSATASTSQQISLSSTSSLINSSLTNFSYFALGTSNVTVAKYYYNSSGSLSTLSSWDLNSVGSGTHPTSFSEDNVTYYLQTATQTLSTTWNVTGSNTVIQIGDGTNATSLTVNGTLNTTGSVLVSCKSSLTTGVGSVVTILGDLGLSSWLGGGCSSVVVDNSGTLTVNGEFQQLSMTNSTINNYGTLNHTGDYILAQGNYFNNYGSFNVTSGSFIIINNDPPSEKFINYALAKVTIDNSSDNSNIVNLAGPNLDLKSLSAFNVIGSNVIVDNILTVNGLLSVKNANMLFHGGGPTTALNINAGGGVYLFDFSGDPSNQTGVLSLANGSVPIVNNGSLYLEGINNPTGSGSNNISVGTTNSSAVISIGNVGLVTPKSYTFTSTNGTVNFCGNITVGADGIGTINAGTLNYTTSDYVAGVNPGSTTPGQNDFTTNSSVIQIPAFATKQACMDQFMADVLAAIPSAIPPSSNVLPISLEYFDVKLNGERVAIEWRTATETNNDFFTVMKSYDASTFEILGTVNGAGTSTVKHNYKFYDEEPQNGINYYKVKQTDFDDVSTYTPTKSIKFKKKNVYMQVYPIPGKIEDITIKLWSEKSETVTIMISDLLGRVYSSGQVEVSKDKIEIPLTSFAEFVSGKYIVTIVSKMFVENIEIIVE